MAKINEDADLTGIVSAYVVVFAIISAAFGGLVTIAILISLNLM
jgi:hypothetical protein